MKKGYKVMLSVTSVIYLLGLCVIIWPEIVEDGVRFLNQFQLGVTIHSDTIVDYYGLGLLMMTGLLCVISLAWPTQLPNVLLKQTKYGQLTISNQGVSQFIRTQLVREGLSNVQVRIKNTRHQRKFYIMAEAPYQRAVVERLPKIRNQITKSLTDLFGDSMTMPIDVTLKLNQKSNTKHRIARVI
jgi:hypothetical protein